MTEITHEALEALSEKATQGMLRLYGEPDVGLDYEPFFGEPLKGGMRPLQPMTREDEAFVMALWNAYRTGQLIHAVPSGDEVEVVARAIRRSEIGNFSDEARAQYVVDGSWEHRIPEATAAITALDAVRVK